jgi:subtilisin family serine protease
MAFLLAPTLPLKLALQSLSQGLSGPEAAMSLFGALGGKHLESIDTGLARIGLLRVNEIDEVAASLESYGLIKIVDETHKVGIDWPTLSTGETTAAAASHLSTIGISETVRKNAGDGVRIGIIDTGVDLTHPEFDADTVVEAADVFVDHKHDISDLSTLDDWHGHGTQVASLAVGKNLGVAPKAKLVIARLGKDAARGYETAGAVCQAIKWLTETRADTQPRAHIVNMSLVCDHQNRSDLAAVFAGTGVRHLMVGASGNWGGPLDSCALPALLPDVIAVGATQKIATNPEVWKVWANSGWGFNANSSAGTCQPKPNLHAPGVNIVTAFPDSKYYFSSGTSMATALVSGALAAILSVQTAALAATNQTPDAGSIKRELIRLAHCLRTTRPGGFHLNLSGL